MAAKQLVINVPSIDTSESTANKVRRYLAPTTGAPKWYRLFCASDLYLELGDVTDAASLGSAYETLKGGVEHVRAIRRGEFGLACAATSASVEVTAMSSVGPG